MMDSRFNAKMAKSAIHANQALGEDRDRRQKRFDRGIADLHARHVAPHLIGDTLEETRDRCAQWLMNFLKNF